ncbi:MAG: hypothetical protein WC842_02290 [Candidatus Paceibacterota bacterium]|jgi:dephospho-CoA kinase
MKTIYLGISGEIGSGKDTIGHNLKTYKNAGVLVSSELLGKILSLLHLDPEERNLLQKLPLGLREHLGETVISDAMIQDMITSKKCIVAWNGVRFQSDVMAIKKLPNSFIVGLDTNPEIRFQRIKKRGQKSGEAELTWELFQEQSNKPTEKSIREIITNADFILENNGTEIDFYKKIDELIEKINLKTNPQ